MSQSGRAVWSVVTALAVALSVVSLHSAGGTTSHAGCCLPENGGCVNLANQFACTTLENGTFEEHFVCGADNETCEPARIGCCDTTFESCFDNISELDCTFAVNATFVPDAICETAPMAVGSAIGAIGSCATFTATPSATATATATATPTGTTMVPDGGSCVDPADCVSGNCVDDVCCDTACAGAGESCNLPGQVGTCSADFVAPAPAVSNAGMIAALLSLLGVGIAGLGIRRRGQL